ncbi:MAG: hypothetical protein C4560_00075 [Nitrospiraceae bacterium]|nr:MAG: hypothetical protein C4560_00075 [Nitrospiraceae bacterium]
MQFGVLTLTFCGDIYLIYFNRIVLPGRRKAMTLLNMRRLFFWVAVVCVPILVSLPGISGRGLHAHDALKGLEKSFFSDPTIIHEMPEGWENKPVRHEPSAADADIAVSLDQHLYPLFLPVIQEYAKKNNLKIAVSEGTCGIVTGMVERKTVDIGGLCCPPGKIDRLPGLKFLTAGIAPVALLVHPGNSIDNVTLEEARNIFKGKTLRWSDIKTPGGKKGPDIPIKPVGRLHCKLRPAEWQLLLPGEDLFGPGLTEVGAIPDMISQVAREPGAIGYEVTWNMARFKDKGNVKAIKINGYSPYDHARVIEGRYPLFRVYTFSIWEGKGVENPGAGKLVKFLLQETERLSGEHNVVPASRLRKAGWKFFGDELTGGPQ